MLHPNERRRRLERITRCSVQWIALGLCIITGCQAFSFSKHNRSGNSFSSTVRRGTLWNFEKGATTILSLYEESKDENDDDDDTESTSASASDSQYGLPALGPARMSSNNDSGDAASVDAASAATATLHDENSDNNTNNTNSVPTFVNPKFALQYTCNICETTNRVIVSRQAYREGYVIVMCKGCDNKHWIADNLDPTLSHSNIEEYFESRGEQGTINRVTKEVYEIERVFGLKEGEITDESGDTVLE